LPETCALKECGFLKKASSFEEEIFKKKIVSRVLDFHGLNEDPGI
jgi:hypothetical protein